MIKKEGIRMITLVYDVLFGHTMLSIIDGECTKVQEGEPVDSVFTGCLRRQRVRHLEYWHPE
jgi:hypothetical protein